MQSAQDPSTLGFVITFATGSISAFIAHYILQVYVIPHVEITKRREARWEENVNSLGELMTTDLKKSATDYHGGIKLLAQLYSEENKKLDLSRDTSSIRSLIKEWEEKTSSAQKEYDIATTRMMWLCGRIQSINKNNTEMARLSLAAVRLQAVDVDIYTSMIAKSDDLERLEQLQEEERGVRQDILKIVEKLAEEGPKKYRRKPVQANAKIMARKLKKRFKNTKIPKLKKSPNKTNGEPQE